MKVLEFNQVHRAYGRGTDVLDDVSFTIRKGEVVGLLGRNGAGKTTLIRIAMGMLEAERGSVRVFDLDPREHPVEVKRRIGYVSEDQILPPFLRVEAVMDMHRTLFNDWDDDAARHLVNRFNLPPRAKVGSLSKGQARQVALLCAVAHRPELLLLDEPAGGLDPAARREFLETSITHLNQTGATILFSSHHMTDVERMAERVVLLHNRRVLIDNELDELREAFSVALVPHGAHGGNGTRERLAAQPTCLSVRERSDAMHAVFRLDPDGTREVLAQMGIDDAHCRSVALEEMFIELVEGQS
jgi:ABC-2 type transport system ATP-binding protein